MRSRWEHFPHLSDVGVRGFGPSIEAAFEQAALALTAVTTDPGSVRADVPVQVSCTAADDELLLADWLNAIVYEAAHRNMLFSRFEVRISNRSLAGKLWGEKVDPRRHHPAVEVKGATYTELSVRRQDEGWLAQCVVDV